MVSKEMSQEKVRRMARILRIVVQVFFWFCIVAVALGGIAVLVILFVPETAFMITGDTRPGFSLTVDGMVRYQVDSQVETDLCIKPVVQAVSTMAVLLLAGLAGMFQQLRDVLRTVEEDRPFVKENSRRIRIIGVILIFGSLVYDVAGGYVASSIIHAMNIPNMSVNFSVDMFMLLTGFMMLVLAGVFRYGSFLQEEYDSTL